VIWLITCSRISTLSMLRRCWLFRTRVFREVLFGGCGPDQDRLAAIELNTGRVHLRGEYRVVLPDGQPLPPGMRVMGRGSRLHFLTGTYWDQLDVGDIPI
jgi:hypothetical protein